MYSLDTGLVFDPCDLSVEVTPDNVIEAISDCKFSSALMMSLQLNEADLITKTVESVPISDGEKYLVATVAEYHRCYVRYIILFNSQEKAMEVKLRI